MEDLPAAQAFCTFLTDFLFSNFIFFTYENMGSLKKLLSTTSRFMDVVDNNASRISMTVSINYVQKVIIASILSNIVKIKTFPNQDVSVLN